MTVPYQAYFGLAEAPFSIAPAPRYLYMSQRHQEALAHLLYGIEGEGGFVLLTGEVGTGKTTVCRGLLERIPESCDVAYIFNPRLTVEELLATLCEEFGIEYPPGGTSNKLFVDRINAHLLDLHARGRHAVLIIDEAQNLSAEVLEQMRLLTNLETSERKLLQIILIGQPELAALLARQDLRQLAQRIVARYHLGALTRAEVGAYIRHRLEVAGCQRPLFPASVIGRVHRLTGGVPRLINVLCDRALLGAYVLGRERVDRRILARAAREAFGWPAPWWQGRWPLAGAALLVGAGALALGLYRPAPEPVTPPLEADVAVAEVAPPSRLDWPAGAARADHARLADDALLAAWGVGGEAAPPAAGDWCARARAAGLECLSGRGVLDDLRRIDRPAALRLRAADSGEFDAVLVGLEADADVARFLIGGHEIRVGLAALATQWHGHYRLLWRRPAAVPDTVRPGDRGEPARWLRARLGLADGGEHFDAALVAEVKRFQRAQGLNPDGSVGRLTLLRLLAATGTDAPRLLPGNTTPANPASTSPTPTNPTPANPEHRHVVHP